MLHSSVTNFISSFAEEFNPEEKATKQAKKDIKEQGLKLTPDLIEEKKLQILEKWNVKRQLGNTIHKSIQDTLVKKEEAIYEGVSKGEGVNLEEGLLLKNNTTYLEKKCVDINYKLIGFADCVTIKDNFINITDYKTWDKVYVSSSFTTETGFKTQPKYMNYPVGHVQDCNFSKACLQLSLYMYMLWNSNKTLKVGKLEMEHISINEKGTILQRQMYHVPYMRDEVKAMLRYNKLNSEV